MGNDHQELFQSISGWFICGGVITVFTRVAQGELGHQTVLLFHPRFNTPKKSQKTTRFFPSHLIQDATSINNSGLSLLQPLGGSPLWQNYHNVWSHWTKIFQVFSLQSLEMPTNGRITRETAAQFQHVVAHSCFWMIKSSYEHLPRWDKTGPCN